MANNLIALSGKARSGKNTVAAIIRLASSWEESDYFKYRYPDKHQFILDALTFHHKVSYSASAYTEIAFADILKGVISLIFKLEDTDMLYDEVGKNSPNSLDLTADDGHVYTYRELLQKIGTDVGRVINPDIWIKSTFGFMDPDKKYIITDVRFPNELQACKDKGALCVRINRDVTNMEHESEHALDECTNFDVIIENNGTLEDLINIVLEKISL